MVSLKIIDINLPEPTMKIIGLNEPNTIIIVDSLQYADIYSLDQEYRDNYKCAMFPYHYYIRVDGSIYRGRKDNLFAPNLRKILSGEPSTTVTNEFTGNNYVDSVIRNKLFVCFEGDSSNRNVTEEQYSSISYLCKFIKSNFNIKKIYGYKEIISGFDYPGIYFKLNELKSSIDSINMPDYVIAPTGVVTYTFGKRDLIYDPDKIMSGNDIKLLQIYMNQINFNIKVTGRYDLITYKSIQLFQRQRYLTVNGKVTKEVYDQINLEINKMSKRNTDSYNRLIKYDLPFMYGKDILKLNNKLADLNLPNIAMSDGTSIPIVKNKLKNIEICTMDTLYAVASYLINYQGKTFVFDNQQDIIDNIIVGPIMYNDILLQVTYEWSFAEGSIKLTSPYTECSEVLFIQKFIKKFFNTFSLQTLSMSGLYDDITANNILMIKMQLGWVPNNEVDSKFYEYITQLYNDNSL